MRCLRREVSRPGWPAGLTRAGPGPRDGSLIIAGRYLVVEEVASHHPACCLSGRAAARAAGIGSSAGHGRHRTTVASTVRVGAFPWGASRDSSASQGGYVRHANRVVVAAMSSGARRCGNDVVGAGPGARLAGPPNEPTGMTVRAGPR